MEDLLKRVLNARVSEVLPEPTPLSQAMLLSSRLDLPVWLKREDLTPVFSFKLRGAYNRIAQLDEEQVQRGVIAASAGNHAQGVAFACRRRGAPCHIVMPRTTPQIKVDAVRSYGAHIELVGDSYSDAAAHCEALAEQKQLTLIPPFDDLDVIAGQGTVGLEILRQAPRDLSAVLVPIGGGGLAAGVAAVIRELRPEVEVWGVEPEDSDAMYRSLRAQSAVELPRVGIFADGVAVKQVGKHTLALCQRYLSGVIRVSQDEICAAIKDGFQDTRTLLEPAGALSIAGLKRLCEEGMPRKGSHVAVASGANLALNRMGYIAERAEVGEEREALLSVTIPEQRGAFLSFCSALGERSVTEFNYRLSSRTRAHVFVGVEVHGHRERARLKEKLDTQGYECIDLSEDELAKTHLRHMVGGISAQAHDERMYTFEFPERPGALRQFLQALGSRWNISAFHYRNHGAGFGRVLCGFEVPDAERADLEATLRSLGFAYRPVENQAITRFLVRAEG